MKKRFATFLILIISIMLVGCASVEYTRVYSTTGTIIDQVTINLKKSDFTSGQAQTMYQIVKSDVDNISNKVDNWINEYITGYVDDVSLKDYFSEGIKIDITEIGETTKSFYFSFFIQFNSLNHFIYFYGFNTPEIVEKLGAVKIDNVTPFIESDLGPLLSNYLNDDYVVDDTPLFTTKYIWSTSNIYDNFIEIERSEDQTYIDYYVSRVNNILDKAYTKDEILDNIEVIQSFQTDNSRLKANSDYMDKTSIPGFSIYSWDLSGNSGQTIDIYRERPVTVWWYVGALIVASICVAVMFIKLKSKKIKGNKNGQ